MDILLKNLETAFPELNFQAGSKFTWSPKTSSIIYNSSADPSDEVANWSLLHEAGHALLGHNTYDSDFSLLTMEIEAWDRARELAVDFEYSIDENHIQDCLDTYRDWLYARSTCPACTSSSVQINSKSYKCFNCGTQWYVSESRHCRPYRLKQKETLIEESL